MSKLAAQGLKASIQKLQKQLEKLVGQKNTAIDKVLRLMKTLDLTISDLRRANARTPAKTRRTRSRAPQATKSPPPTKYRDGQGNTWSGRGKNPRWLTAAIAAGKTRDEFKV